MKEKLLRMGFLTGSRAYGTAGRDSDWDIVINRPDLERVHAMLKGLTLKPSSYFSGFHVTIDHESINIIPVHPDEYERLYTVTRMVTEACHDWRLSKPAIYGLFEILRGYLKGINPTVK
jgi:hypothetical protein